MSVVDIGYTSQDMVTTTYGEMTGVASDRSVTTSLGGGSITSSTDIRPDGTLSNSTGIEGNILGLVDGHTRNTIEIAPGGLLTATSDVELNLLTNDVSIQETQELDAEGNISNNRMRTADGIFTDTTTTAAGALDGETAAITTTTARTDSGRFSHETITSETATYPDGSASITTTYR